MSAAPSVEHPGQFLADVVMATWKTEIAKAQATGAAAIASAEAVVIAVDADCPACRWPERTYSTETRTFGCIKCTYTSDEREA